MVIKTLNAFTVRNTSTGDLTSLAFGVIATVDDTLGAQLISDGLAEEYSPIVPTGSVTLTANGSYEVTLYETAVVNVGLRTITYDENGGTGTVAAQSVVAGNSAVLDDGSGLTPPTDKVFAGWATTNDATEPDVTSPYTPESDITIYAVWVDE